MSEETSTIRSQVWRLGGRLVGYLRRYRLLFAGALLVMLLLAAVDRGRALLLKPFFDAFEKAERTARCDACGALSTAEKEGTLRHCVGCGLPVKPRGIDKDILKKLVLLGLGLSVLIFPLKYAKEYLVHYVAQRVLLDLRNDLSSHLLRLPLRFYHDRKSGDLLSRLTNDTVLMNQALAFLFEDLFLQPFLILGALGVLSFVDWRLGVGAALFFPLYGIFLARIGKGMRRVRKQSLERLGGVTESVMQASSGIRIVKAFNMEKEEEREFRDLNEGYFRKMMSMVRKKALAESVVEVFISLGVALILVAGFLFIKDMRAGDVIVFALGLAMINTPVKELTKGWSRLQESLAAADRVFEILDAPPETADAPDAVDLPEVREISYRGVTFAYNSEPVLRGIDLTARPGEVVAVVGRSGSGKSTLVDLLCRYYDPQEGEVAVNGTSLRRVRRSALLSHVAVVTQETFLFNATIGENIRYGRRDAGQEEVEQAARAANIHDFILTLEKGYDTVVGERGAKLSGGQRQRVAIARAFLKNPSILILDEATSALDVESEQAVQAALDGLVRASRRITFVIAHRLSTVKNADRILVLDDGRLVDQGRHEELLARGGVYAMLYQTQFAV